MSTNASSVLLNKRFRMEGSNLNIRPSSAIAQPATKGRIGHVEDRCSGITLYKSTRHYIGVAPPSSAPAAMRALSGILARTA